MTLVVKDRINPEFWNSGAFLRLDSEQVWVAIGPWTQVAEDYGDFGHMEFFGSSPKWFKSHSSQILKLENFRNLIEPELKNSAGNSLLSRENFTKASSTDFSESFKIIQGKIHRGEIEKAVSISRIKANREMTSADLAQAVFSLIKLPEVLNSYGFWNAGVGVLGASPEILFEKNNKDLKTMALAGSRPLGSSDRMPLGKDPKEIREHGMVVTDLASRLMGLGYVRQHSTEILQLPAIEHLLTRFEVQGCTKTLSEIIHWMHPTPAMAVHPRQYGFHWLRELSDQRERGLFGAPICFKFDAKVSRTLVAIRSLFWNQREVSLYAGCGIVKDSQLDREWEEIKLKMHSSLKQLGLVQTGTESWEI